MTAIVELDINAEKIFIFDEVYPFRAAQEQANKKKLNAFGLMAKLNPLNRPKEDTVLLRKEELRFEPMWQLIARREVDYSCEVIYPVAVHNPYASSIMIDEKKYEVTRQGEKAKIDLQVIEKCHRKLDYSAFIDGLKRDIKPLILESYLKKYKFSEVSEVTRSEAILPLISSTSIKQIAYGNLHREIINAHEIHLDILHIERAYLYFRPVYAFEFVWGPQDKTGVIEVDGLTGEVIENGQWFKEKVGRVMTREMLFEVGAEVAGAFVPGGGLAIKVIDKISN